MFEMDWKGSWTFRVRFVMGGRCDRDRIQIAEGGSTLSRTLMRLI